MAIDSGLPIRRGLLIAMKATPALVGIVPEGSIYGQTVPASRTFPFVRCGSFIATPIVGACIDGQEAVGAVHAFTKPRRSGGRIVETAEDLAHRVAAAVAAALDRHSFALPSGRATIRYRSAQVIQDADEADCYHAIVSLKVRAITA